MRRYVIASVIAALAPFSAHASDRWPDAFSRRDFKLGMTLSQFKATPFPDKTYSDAIAVCSDSKGRGPYSEVVVDDEVLAAAGGVMCRFFDPSSDDPQGIGLGLADTELYTDFFFMPPADGEEPVLFRIETQAPASMFNPVMPIMKQGYGDPTHSVQTLKNGLGQSVDNDIYEWKRGDSTVSFYHYWTSLDGAMLIHSLDPVANRLKILEDAADKARAQKL